MIPMTGETWSIAPMTDKKTKVVWKSRHFEDKTFSTEQRRDQFDLPFDMVSEDWIAELKRRLSNSGYEISDTFIVTGVIISKGGLNEPSAKDRYMDGR